MEKKDKIAKSISLLWALVLLAFISITIFSISDNLKAFQTTSSVDDFFAGIGIIVAIIFCLGFSFPTVIILYGSIKRKHWFRIGSIIYALILAFIFGYIVIIGTQDIIKSRYFSFYNQIWLLFEMIIIVISAIIFIFLIKPYINNYLSKST